MQPGSLHFPHRGVQFEVKKKADTQSRDQRERRVQGQIPRCLFVPSPVQRDSVQVDPCLTEASVRRVRSTGSWGVLSRVVGCSQPGHRVWSLKSCIAVPRVTGYGLQGCRVRSLGHRVRSPGVRSTVPGSQGTVPGSQGTVPRGAGYGLQGCGVRFPGVRGEVPLGCGVRYPGCILQGHRVWSRVRF